MGFIGLLIGVVILICIFAFSYLSNSPTTITPGKSEQIKTEAQEIIDEATEKTQLEQNQIENVNRP